MSYDVRNTGPTLARHFAAQFGAQLGHPRGALGAVVGRLIFAKGNAPLNTWLVGRLDLQSTDHVLEAGCGPGIAVRAIAARLPEGRVVGVDHSSIMIRQARRRNAAAIRTGRVEILLGDAAALPFADGIFDFVIATHVLYFVANPVSMLRELRRVLRPGGTIAIGFALEQDAPRMARTAFARSGATFPPTTDTVEEALRAAGFTHTHVEVQREGTTLLARYCAVGQKPPDDPACADERGHANLEKMA